MARRPKLPTIDEVIAIEVRRALAQRFAAMLEEAPSARRRARAAPAGKPGRRRAAAAGQRPAGASAALPAETAAERSSGDLAAGPPPEATADAAASAGTAASPSSSDIVDRVRSELSAAYDGRPVSPDRLAFRLKADRVLVDAALTYLVSRKEARMVGARGKVAYIPQRAR